LPSGESYCPLFIYFVLDDLYAERNDMYNDPKTSVNIPLENKFDDDQNITVASELPFIDQSLIGKH